MFSFMPFFFLLFHWTNLVSCKLISSENTVWYKQVFTKWKVKSYNLYDISRNNSLSLVLLFVYGFIFVFTFSTTEALTKLWFDRWSIIISRFCAEHSLKTPTYVLEGNRVPLVLVIALVHNSLIEVPLGKTRPGITCWSQTEALASMDPGLGAPSKVSHWL